MSKKRITENEYMNQEILCLNKDFKNVLNSFFILGQGGERRK